MKLAGTNYNYGFSGGISDEIPPRPWGVERYGFSLAQVRDAHGHLVLDELNFAIAKFIVQKVNEGT